MGRLLSTSAMVVLVLAAVCAQSGGSGSIAGRVVDATSGAPLHRARVEIHVEGHTDIRGLARRMATDDSCCARFRRASTVSKSRGAAMGRWPTARAARMPKGGC